MCVVIQKLVSTLDRKSDVMTLYQIEPAGGLHAFLLDDYEPPVARGWYVLGPALARLIDTSNMSLVFKRNEGFGGKRVKLERSVLKSQSRLGVWQRLLETHTHIMSKVDASRRKRRSTSRVQNLSLYPIGVAVRVVLHYKERLPEKAIREMEVFYEGHRSADSESDFDASSESLDQKEEGVRPRVKQEPGSYLSFRTQMIGPRIVIDLTDSAGGADTDEALAASISDNFLAPRPPVALDMQLKRSYRLEDKDIAERFKNQCIRFGEWRQAIYVWSRDEGSVKPRTVDNNISNLLLFAGYATKHAPLASRITPASAFELGVVFASAERLKPLVLSYLTWLRGRRRVTYSTALGYLNSLVVFARFYAATREGEAQHSFEGGDGSDVVAGLRRLRSHAHAQAQAERLQKPLHPDWIAWRTAQHARREAAHTYRNQQDGFLGRELRKLYRKLEKMRKKNESVRGRRAQCIQIAAHPLFQSLQELIFLYVHTITAPVRVSIVRTLQFRTTFRKRRSDPSRYVINLKDNPNSPSASHKTAAHYRRAIFPMPKIECMTELIDQRRLIKLSELNHNRHVFVNRFGKPFSSSAWTEFAKRAWREFAIVDGRRRRPPPSLLRTIFVTWLNGIPYNEEDVSFLQQLQQSAADFQTHALATANSLYDKDAQSYDRMLKLTELCEQFSTFVATESEEEEQWQLDLDSDHEAFQSVAPVARQRRGGASQPPVHLEEQEEEKRVVLEPQPSPSDCLRVEEEESGSEENEEPANQPTNQPRYEARMCVRLAVGCCWDFKI